MMINLKEYKDQKEIFNLLAECMYTDERRVIQEYEQYINDGTRILLGRIENHELVGLIGILNTSNEEIEIKHIAIKSGNRKRGLGKKLIQEYIRENQIRRVEAETDKDAVDFYRRLGFNITSLGQKYPGVERFQCSLIIRK